MRIGSSSFPLISIVTPLTTLWREKFINSMTQNVSRSYPHARIEWLVVGDSRVGYRHKTSVRTKFLSNKTSMYLVDSYYPCNTAGDIGAKRNVTCSNASRKVTSKIDSDDFL